MTPVELETLDELRAWCEGHDSLDGTVLQGLDLRGVEGLLAAHDVAGALVLGCVLDAAPQADLVARGALVLPRFDEGVPFDPHRPGLYGVEDLYGGFDPSRPASYGDTFDARVYRHWVATGGGEPPSIRETLARRLHDHAVTDALYDFLDERGLRSSVVAVMGGHGMRRDAPVYRDVVRLSRRLSRAGFLMVSGGGPGAMEATHLGAFLAPWPDGALDEALRLLAQEPGFDRTRAGEWLAAAFTVRERFPVADDTSGPGVSVGIPTWLYGHEPPCAFATHAAKYFANSVREDGLLTIATAGVIYSPGSAGTVQEIFLDACQNYYESVGFASPMIFLGREHWTETLPAYPLVEKMGRDAKKRYVDLLRLTDDADEAASAIEGFRSASPR